MGRLCYQIFRGSKCLANTFIKIFLFYDSSNRFFSCTYKKNTIKILKDAGFPAVLGGLVMSLSFIAFVVAMTNTTVANVVFIISTQTMFLAIFGYFYLKEKVSLVSFISILLAMSGITVMVGDSLFQDLFLVIL